MLACAFGHDKIVALLLQEDGVGANSSDPWECRTPLFYSARRGHHRIVQTLLERPETVVDPRDHTGATPLAIAASFGNVEVVKQLLQTKKVNINSQDDRGRTPISEGK
jgi:ankyrin repeat protein